MKILLICTHNACRSIIGEAVINKTAASRITARSAGSSPRGEIHPLTLKHLRRRDYDISSLKSQSWNDFEHWIPDVIITLCDQAAGETCPIYFNDCLKIHWGLSDPSKGHKNEQENFDHTINTLEERIKKLLNENFEDMNADQLSSLFNNII